MRKFFLSVVSCLLVVVIVVAQGNCPEIVQQALQSAEVECSAAGRNQICYGNNSLEVEAQPDASDFSFDNVGDITDVAAIQSLQLAGLDAANGTWGLVLMRVQANIPDTLPGQNVTIMLFGDSSIRNAATSVSQQVPPEQQQTIQSSQNVNVRELPSTAGRVLGSAAPGTTLTATGRSADNAWVRVIFGEQVGWISASLLSSDASMNDLLVVEPDTPQFGPMQAFYFSAGIGQTNCSEVPGNGMLIQTPEGVASVDLMVNEVQVSMGSTIYFTVNSGRQMAVYSLEGGARVTADGKTQTSVEGTRIRIPLGEDFAAEGEPLEVESYADNETLGFLPIDGLEREIEIDEPLTDEELALFDEYDAVFENIDIDDVDEMFDYIDEHWDDADFDIAEYLIDDLDYTEFDDDLEAYFEDDLGYDLSDYDDYFGDDFEDDDAVDDFGDDESFDDFGDEDDDEYEDDDYEDDYEDDYGDDYGDDGGDDDEGD